MFNGWSKTVDGSVDYDDEATVKNLTTEFETVTLYAVWGDANAKLTLPTPVREGYKFKGWKGINEIVYDGGEVYTPTSTKSKA